MISALLDETSFSEDCIRCQRTFTAGEWLQMIPQTVLVENTVARYCPACVTATLREFAKNTIDKAATAC